MEKITFQTIVDSLQCGQEIEFSYNNKQYSITSSNGYWNFCCDTDSRTIEKICPFEDKSTIISQVASYCIDGTPIPMIFNEQAVSSVCIL